MRRARVYIPGVHSGRILHPLGRSVSAYSRRRQYRSGQSMWRSSDSIAVSRRRAGEPCLSCDKPLPARLIPSCRASAVECARLTGSPDSNRHGRGTGPFYHDGECETWQIESTRLRCPRAAYLTSRTDMRALASGRAVNAVSGRFAVSTCSARAYSGREPSEPFFLPAGRGVGEIAGTILSGRSAVGAGREMHLQVAETVSTGPEVVAKSTNLRPDSAVRGRVWSSRRVGSGDE